MGKPHALHTTFARTFCSPFRSLCTQLISSVVTDNFIPVSQSLSSVSYINFYPKCTWLSLSYPLEKFAISVNVRKVGLGSKVLNFSPHPKQQGPYSTYGFRLSWPCSEISFFWSNDTAEPPATQSNGCSLHSHVRSEEMLVSRCANMNI